MRSHPLCAFFLYVFLFIYSTVPSLSCGPWDRVPQLGIKLSSPALAWGGVLATGPPRKALHFALTLDIFLPGHQ